MFDLGPLGTQANEEERKSLLVRLQQFYEDELLMPLNPIKVGPERCDNAG